jgi:hypothetical protein
MTDHVARLYAIAFALLVFFCTWAAVASRPWGEPDAADPRVAALDRREQRLEVRRVRVQRTLNRRFADYERRLRERQAQIAAVQAAPVAVAAPSVSAPSVGTVSSQPVTSTRSS